MKLQKTLFMVPILFLFLSSSTAVIAGDFAWIPDFNRKAEADLPGFRASLSARFNIGAVQIDAILTNVPSPADAYMIFHLGEMSGKPVDYVFGQYKTGKGKGWGVLAKSLGIKPGSQEFHALKQGHDLYKGGNFDKGKNANMGSNNDIGRGKGKGKNK
jgi:hypothetical protein